MGKSAHKRCRLGGWHGGLGGEQEPEKGQKKRKEDLRQVRNAKGKIQVREVDGSCYNLPPPLEGSV